MTQLTQANINRHVSLNLTVSQLLQASLL